MFVIDIVHYLIIAYFGFSVAYIFLFAVSSYFFKSSPEKANPKLNKFLILIPAYKEDAIILNTAHNAVKQDYPEDLFDVYIIADSLKPETIRQFKEEEINCIEVSFAQSTKARSINKALKTIKEEYDAVVILDADNIMENEFLHKVNYAFANGHKAIQGHRVAKNLDSQFAILDGISEEINNTIFRKGHVAIGLSSALIGSAMAFDYHLYKTIMDDIDTFADEDKELEIKIFLSRNKIEYLNHAFVYDEKVSNSEIFVKQRSRWISSQIYYARTFLFRSIRELILRGNVDLFNKILQFLLVPRIMLLGFSGIFTVASFFIDDNTFFYSWLTIFSACILTLIIAVPKKHYNKSTLVAITRLPYGFLMMILATVKMKLGHKRLSPTPHSTSSDSINKKK